MKSENESQSLFSDNNVGFLNVTKCRRNIKCFELQLNYSLVKK